MNGLRKLAAALVQLLGESTGEFADWVKASPRHLREFLFMEALEIAAKSIDPSHSVDVELDLSQPHGNVVPLSGAAGELSFTSRSDEWQDASTTRTRVPSRAILGFAGAAGLLGVAFGLTWWAAPGLLGGWERYETAVGEQRTVELLDGTAEPQERVLDEILRDGVRSSEPVSEAVQPIKVAVEQLAERFGIAITRSLDDVGQRHRTPSPS